MYTPHKIVLTNFGSHKNTEYTFPTNQTSLLCGINETDDGQKSNGSGKSWIIEALYFLTTDSYLRKINKANAIFYGEKFFIVEGWFRSEVLNQTLYIRKKVFANTTPSEYWVEINDKVPEHLLVNDQEKKRLDVNQCKSFVLETFGLSSDHISDYFIISKEKYTSFFNSSDTAKKDLINRFSKAYIIDPIDDSIKDDINTYSDKKNALERRIHANESKIEAYIESIDQDSNDNGELIKQYQDKITVNIEQIEVKKQLIESNQSYLEDHKLLLADYTKSISEFDPQLKELKTTEKEYETVLRDIEKHLGDEVQCPNCNHKFSFKDKSIPLVELRENLPIIQESLKDVLFQQQIINTQLEQLQKDKKYSQSQYDELQFDITKYTREINMLNNENKSFESTIKDLSKIENSKDAETLQKIETLQSENEQYQKQLEDTNQQLSKCEEWLINFKRFKGYLANQSLCAIESYANFYLEQLKSNIRIKIEGYKEVNKGKDIREKINVIVLKNGIDVGSFYGLSGGEKARIEISVILAMQKLINISTDGRGLNFIVLDEILESLDSLGIEILVKSLNDININILLISQLVNVEKDDSNNYIANINYENIIIVKKINAISEIVHLN